MFYCVVFIYHYVSLSEPFFYLSAPLKGCLYHDALIVVITVSVAEQLGW